MLLAKEQRLGAAILFAVALIGWMVAAFRPQTPEAPAPRPGKKSWAERRDSIRLADSMRYVQWKEEREARYDSVKHALAERHEAYKAELQQWFDSTRLADSLWRDSVGIRYPKRLKKDTVLDLNRCDTAELQLIRGIGRYTAVQIVKYREALGGFYSPSQLTDQALQNLSLDTLLHHFTADSSDVTTIPINYCSTERLQRHPYLRYNQAKAIYTLRRRRVTLHTIDDLRDLPELSEEDLTRLTPYLGFEQ